MRAVLQRVSSASVVVNGGNPRTIGPGTNYIYFWEEF